MCVCVRFFVKSQFSQSKKVPFSGAKLMPDNTDDKMSIVDFTIEQISEFRFENVDQVEQAIIERRIDVGYAFYSKSITFVDSQSLANKVFEKLPPENKVT